MQRANKGGVEGTGTCRAAWRPLTSGETRMPSERPYPGQLWKHDSTHVIVWPCIRTPSPMSSCPEARASPRAWASFLPSSEGCGADRSSPVHTSYAPESDPPSCARRFLHFCDQVLQGRSYSWLVLGQIDRSLPQAGEVGVRKVL